MFITLLSNLTHLVIFVHFSRILQFCFLPASVPWKTWIMDGSIRWKAYLSWTFVRFSDSSKILRCVSKDSIIPRIQHSFFRCNYRAKLSLRGLEQKISTAFETFEKNTTLRRFHWSPNSRKMFDFLSFLSLHLHWPNSLSRSFLFWFLRHNCDCEEISKRAIIFDLYQFSNAYQSKGTGSIGSNKISIQIFENRTRFSSEKGRRISWSLHHKPFFGKLLKMQSLIGSSYLKKLLLEAKNCKLDSTNQRVKQKF